MSENETGLEYSLKFKESSEHDSLYSHGKWSIDEVDKEGKVVNDDLIPWDWGVDFQVTKIIYLAQHESDSNYVDDDELEEHADYESIQGSLDIMPDKDGFRLPDLEMFGTKRVIKDLSLVIYRSSDYEANNEGLSASGGIGFESEIDFRTRTIPDFLQFTLSLNDKKFDELKKLVMANRATSISLRVHRCKGFYSFWSPSISTHVIKILLPYNSQGIELPEGIEDIPRLGEVEKYSFNYSVQNDLVIASENDDDDEEIEELFEDEPVRTREQYIQEKTNNELQSINSTLNKTRNFAIAIVVLLFLILVAS